MDSKATILIIDDEQNICQILTKILSREGYTSITANFGAKGIELFSSEQVDVVLLDFRLPDMDGIEVAKQMTTVNASIPIIMLSAHGTVARAVEATKLGVYDFLEKPPDRERILLTIRNALAQSQLKQELNYYKQDCLARYKMIGHSPSIKQVYNFIEKVAPFNSPVLILGENGVGKELVALAIHNGSSRAKKPIVKINCAAIPENLMESELFGHTKGAFTGAHIAKKGRFQAADGGTLFLDEIGDLSPSAQAKLLRVLESGEIQRVGATQPEFVDVRVIAASNKNLQQMAIEQQFREDLYYRLNGFPITIPPLRQRKEDIPLLVEHFLIDYTNENGLIKPQLSPAAMNFLTGHRWPGNVRQLRHFTERLFLLDNYEFIDLEDVKRLIDHNGDPQISSSENSTTSLTDARDQFEREYITSVLKTTDWRVAKAAELLAMDRANLYRKMKQLGINY